jgi:hypothetical protein
MTTTKETNGLEVGSQREGMLAKCTAACRTAARKLKQLEEQLAAKFAAEAMGTIPGQLIQQAMNEAEALAWSTRYPLLFLPELAEEKVRGARQWASRQQQILHQQNELVTIL